MVGSNPPRYVMLEPPVAFRGVQIVFAAAAIIARRLRRSVLPSVDIAELREKHSVRAEKRAARYGGVYMSVWEGDRSRGEIVMLALYL